MVSSRKLDVYNQLYFQKRGKFFPEIKGLFYSLFIKSFLKPKTLLDVGCAEGRLIKWATRLGIDVYGVDISSMGFSKTETDVFRRCRVGDILNLPFKKNQFEVVSCLALLEHIEEKKTNKALNELLRVAQEYVLLQICVKDNPVEGKHYLLDPTHVSVKKSEWWIRKFRQLNLKVRFSFSKLGFFILDKK